MRRALILAGGAVALALLGLWALGGVTALAEGLGALQRQAQDALAGAVRALRGGQPGAFVALLALCFGYGVLHAAGPGHGKALIGAYGVARRVPLGLLAGLAVASALGQAAVAVALVYAGVAALGLTRDAATGLAERTAPVLGNLLIAALGLWLVWRGLCGLRPGAAGHAHGSGGGHGHARGHSDAHSHPHSDGHEHARDCGCGHAHGPTLAQVQGVTGWRDAALLVAGVALRPCSGALFLLILTWQIGIGAAGIAGAFAMGAGVAAVTVAVAALAVWSREGALATLSGGAMARALPVVQVLAGMVLAGAALVLLARGL